MERETIDWDAIVARARAQREQQPIKPVMSPRARAAGLFWSMVSLGLACLAWSFWPW